MRNKVLGSYVYEVMRSGIRNSGFSLKYSNVKFKVKNPFLRIFTGIILYFAFAIRKAYLITTGKFELDYVEIFITSRCNLRCKDCSVLVPYLPKLEDYNINEAISSLKSLLGIFDCIHKVGILGGEAMMNGDFDRILEFIQAETKIKSIRIVTNGMYIPSKDAFDALKASDKVHVDISNYNLPNNRKEELCTMLKDLNIQYSIYNDMTWHDLGLPNTSGTNDQKIISRRYKYCWMKQCNGILNGKYHMCSRSIFLPLARDINISETDYVDLCNINSKREGRNKFKKLFKKKSIAACAYCNGTFDGVKISPAEQISTVPGE